jgi:hypothetical protein
MLGKGYSFAGDVATGEPKVPLDEPGRMGEAISSLARCGQTRKARVRWTSWRVTSTYRRSVLHSFARVVSCWQEVRRLVHKCKSRSIELEHRTYGDRRLCSRLTPDGDVASAGGSIARLPRGLGTSRKARSRGHLLFAALTLQAYLSLTCPPPSAFTNSSISTELCHSHTAHLITVAPGNNITPTR